MKLSGNVLPALKKDNTDRNRTSPFAFTGNKFEFRMVGSAASIAGPNVILNAIVAEALEEFADKLEAAADFDAAVVELVRETVIAHKRIIFNGDGYTDAWVEEAKSRGLLNLKSTPEALPYMVKEKNISLFVKHGIFTGRSTLHCRFNGGSKEQKRAWHCRQLRNGACFQNCNAQQPALHRCRKIKSRAW